MIMVRGIWCGMCVFIHFSLVKNRKNCAFHTRKMLWGFLAWKNPLTIRAKCPKTPVKWYPPKMGVLVFIKTWRAKLGTYILRVQNHENPMFLACIPPFTIFINQKNRRFQNRKFFGIYKGRYTHFLGVFMKNWKLYNGDFQIEYFLCFFVVLS